MQNARIFSKSILTWVSCFLLYLCPLTQALAAELAPELSILPFQLIGVDNEFARRNAAKIESLHKQLIQSLMTEAQPLDLYLEAQGRTLPLNLKHSIHPVAAGRPTFSMKGPAYVVPLICRAGENLVVATELVTVGENFLLAAKQQFTARAAWEGDGAAPLSINAGWGQDLSRDIRDLDADAPAFKIDFGLSRSSHNSIVGSHECLNMLLSHELQKTMMVPTPLDLLEGYRLRQLLAPGSAPKRSTRSFLLDWGQNPIGPTISVHVMASESVNGTPIEPRGGPITVELKASENRMSVPPAFAQALTDSRDQLLAKDKPMVAKVYGAWVYLDRGRAWGLDMNDRVYFDEGGRFVKGHVVGFYGSGLKLKSPRGFAIQEGAIVFIRKGQRVVKVGDSFDFDHTSYPTPWPPVRQPSKRAG